MWSSVIEAHAALNDLPAALLLAALVFDLLGMITGRESLKSAGFWTLNLAAVGAVLALVSGLSAEEIIEHGSAMHRFIERHETLAIGFTVFTVGLAGWRIARRDAFGPREGKLYLGAMALGFLGIVWVSKIGGNIMFRHAGGISTSVLEAAIADRSAGHMHAPGEEDHEHDETEGSGTVADHEHEPGTPEHEH